MRKHFILSARTLISKRNVTQSFGSDNTVYIPFTVMQEVENKYRDQVDERGKIAQENLKYLGSFHIKQLVDGIKQDNGSTLKVILDYHKQELPEKMKGIELTKLDRDILKACLYVKEGIPNNEKVVLVSKKATLRFNAERIGVKAQTFRDELLPEISEQYKGRKTLYVTDKKLEEFRENKGIPISKVISNQDEPSEFYQNMFIELKGSSKLFTECGRVDGKNIVPLTYEGYKPSCVIPKNIGQKFMIEALMTDVKKAPLVIFKGPAGTAKTFMSLAVGLELVEENKEFPNGILISRTPTETGEKIGYLPGGELEKIGPYLRGIVDNLRNLDAEKKKKKKENQKKETTNCSEEQNENEKTKIETDLEFLAKRGINAEAISYIRGRSIEKTYIIIDEAQNLSPVEVKTIITRVSCGTKIILLGDPAQIDRLDLDERNNGLSYASERFKGSPNCWQVTMTDEESVRSELAKEAAILL